MNLPLQRTARGFASPSNLAITTLLGFLCVGYLTDWEILRGRPSRSAVIATPGMPKVATDSHPSRLRYADPRNSRPLSLNVERQSEFADRRAANHDVKNQSELD